MAYAIRLPANRVLQDRIAYLLKRPVGRPPHEVRRYYASVTYQAHSWKKPRRVVAWRRIALAAKVRHDSRVHLIAPLPSLMTLLAGAALVVEGDDALGRPRQVGDDEADARVKLARMPLDLAPRPRLQPWQLHADTG